MHSRSSLRVRGALKVSTWAERLKSTDSRFKGIKDFRRTTARYVNGVRVAQEDVLPEDQFVLFDLAAESLLEPITQDKDDFRVTCYDPRLMPASLLLEALLSIPSESRK